MLVTFIDDSFNLYSKQLDAKIKTTEDNFDDILSLFMDLSDNENKKRISRVRFMSNGI